MPTAGLFYDIIPFMEIEGINCEMKRSRRRTLSLEIRTPGLLTVRAPLNMPEDEIIRFIREKRSWIMKKMALKENTADLAASVTLKPGTSVPFRGCMAELVYHAGREMYTENIPATESTGSGIQKGGFRTDCGAKLFMPSPASRGSGVEFIRSTDEALELAQNAAMLEYFYRSQAKRLLPAITEFYAARMGLSPKGVHITSARSSWGSCNAKGGINYSFLLMTLCRWEIDYVVVHELAHLRHRDHSAAFYAEVERVLPDHRERTAAMKKDQWVLDILK